MHRMIKRFIFKLSTTLEPKLQDKGNQQLPNQDLEHFIINYIKFNVSIALSTYPSIHVLMDYFVTG